MNDYDFNMKLGTKPFLSVKVHNSPEVFLSEMWEFTHSKPHKSDSEKAHQRSPYNVSLISKKDIVHGLWIQTIEDDLMYLKHSYLHFKNEIFRIK